MIHIASPKRLVLALAAASAFSFVACNQAEVVDAGDDGMSNPFTDPELNSGKSDTFYLNPDGIEVEVDIEADIQAPGWRKAMAPAILGQFALTVLRRSGDLYLESLAEDATSKERVEWLVDEKWMTAAEAKDVEPDKLVHFRIRGMNAVLLHKAAKKAEVGARFEVPVPVRPFDVFSEAGDGCAEPDGHMTLSQSIYWYMWDPDRSGCKAEVQKMSVTVSKVLPVREETYPEYDQLVADGKVTAVVLFGQIGDELNDSDTGVRELERMSGWLRDGGFQKVEPAPVGRRFTKHIAGVDFEVDLYSPYEFAGLSDYEHLPNFKKALEEHEIVVYDGHSMLGASDFWTKPTYPEYYQVFIYGGCLGYEYYVQPILKSKGGWDKVDIVSSVVEVSVGATYFAAPALAKIAWALENGYAASWKDLLIAIRKRVGDSTFGASGVRDNCFTPQGSRCGGEEPDLPGPGALHYTDEANAKIPDADAGGVERTIEAAGEGIVEKVTLDLKITHFWPQDLIVTLEHEGVEAKVFDSAAGTSNGIEDSFVLGDFAGKKAAGKWTLHVVDKEAPDSGTLDSWTLTIVVASP